MKIIDLYAGPGGVDTGYVQALPGARIIGYELDADACATARAAGHARIQGDLTTAEVPDDIDLLHASPPCPGFSAAGKGVGRKDLSLLVGAALNLARSDVGYADVVCEIERVRRLAADWRSHHVLEALRWVAVARPAFVTMEQVPTVLPAWNAVAQTLRVWGYGVWAGTVRSEQYGVPRTRKRALLIARRGAAEVTAAPPTHSRYYARDPQRLDAGVLPWVSMYEALGWGMTGRPAMTVTGGGVASGGAEPFGNAARRAMRQEAEAGRWVRRLSGRPPRREKAQGPLERITVAEAGALQGFPTDYPWQGATKGSRYQQVGNACPPPLMSAFAAHLVYGSAAGLVELAA